MPLPQIDEWKTVTKNDKKRAAKNRRRKSGKSTALWQENHAVDSVSNSQPMSNNDLDSIISHCQKQLQAAEFYANLQEAVLRCPPPSSIVCYGIGNFGKQQSLPSAPLWQLACVMEIQEMWKNQGNDIPIYYFEPFMTPDEKSFLIRSSIQIITENERGRRKVSDATFFFMPHCPLDLYCNLLFENFGCLTYVIILGNSLSAYANRLEQNESTALLKHLQPFWTEVSITMSKDDLSSLPGLFEQAFNDCAVTSFHEVIDLPKLPQSLEKELTNLKDKKSLGEVV